MRVFFLSRRAPPQDPEESRPSDQGRGGNRDGLGALWLEPPLASGENGHASLPPFGRELGSMLGGAASAAAAAAGASLTSASPFWGVGASLESAQPDGRDTPRDKDRVSGPSAGTPADDHTSVALACGINRGVQVQAPVEGAVVAPSPHPPAGHFPSSPSARGSMGGDTSLQGLQSLSMLDLVSVLRPLAETRDSLGGDDDTSPDALGDHVSELDPRSDARLSVTLEDPGPADDASSLSAPPSSAGESGRNSGRLGSRRNSGRIGSGRNSGRLGSGLRRSPHGSHTSLSELGKGPSRSSIASHAPSNELGGDPLPRTSSGRFRLTRTRSSLQLLAGAASPKGGASSTGRPGAPGRSPSFRVDLGAFCFGMLLAGQWPPYPLRRGSSLHRPPGRPQQGRPRFASTSVRGSPG